MTLQKDPEGNEARHLKGFADFGGRRVLEIGCGDGRLTWRYAASAARVTGIDVDRDSLRIATIERAADLEHIATFAQADSVHLPFRKETFDLAVLAWSF